MSVLRLLLNCPDRSTAERITDVLLDAKLIGCANIYPEIASLYVWASARQSETEVPLVMNTRPELWPEIEPEVARLHPYDVPPLVGDLLDFATQSYADWVVEVTRAPS